MRLISSSLFVQKQMFFEAAALATTKTSWFAAIIRASTLLSKGRLV